MLLSRDKAQGRDKDREWGNRANYNLHKDTDTGNLKGSYRDTDTCMDMGNSNLLDTDRDMCKCKSGYNSTGYNRASDTGFGTGIRNPDQHCRRCTAGLRLKEPGTNFGS